MPPKKKVSAAAAAPQEDVSMADASSPAGMPEPEDDMMIDEQRIRIVSVISYRWF
jgi:DNA-directed RNA polymerase I and III subunit RPAC2